MAWNENPSEERIHQMMKSLFVCQAFLTGFPVTCYGGPVYLYPLADYTGTAEVVHGGTNGYEGLGFVSSSARHPSLPYNSLSFHGTFSSFAELRAGMQYMTDSDWSLIMFVKSSAPIQGTLFDLRYGGPGEPDQVWSNKIKLELNGTHIVLTIFGPFGGDYGAGFYGTTFTSEEWSPLSVIHDSLNGNVYIQTLHTKVFTNKGLYKNQNRIKLPQPTKIKLGGSYDTKSYPFEGSVVCFAMYDAKVSSTSFADTLSECLPTKWQNIPNSIDLSNVTTQAPLSTTPNSPSFSTTPGTTTTATDTRTPGDIQITSSATSTGTASSTAEIGMLDSTATDNATTETIRVTFTTSSMPTKTDGTPIATVLPATTSQQVIFQPQPYGYFEVVAMDTRPSVAAISVASHCRSNRRCGQLCLIIPGCLCFTYSSSTCLCSLYNKMFGTEEHYGTNYYKRRDIS